MSPPDLHKFGLILVEGGDLDDARDSFERICKLFNSTLSPDRELKMQYFETLQSLIQLRLTMKKYDVAHQEGKILSQIIHDLYPENGSTASSIPVNHSVSNQPSNDSVEHLESVDYPRSNALGVVGMTLIWNDPCDHEKAKEYLLQSLRSRQLYYGKIHTSNAFVCHLLAIVYRKLHNFHLAVHYHHMAIRMYEILLGEKNLVTLSCVGELGITIQSRASFQVYTSFVCSQYNADGSL